jgi:hypothetical protein
MGMVHNNKLTARLVEGSSIRPHIPNLT